jgi:hypothetical protein
MRAPLMYSVGGLCAMEETRILLWSDGAPGAMGNGMEDMPAITPYLVQADKPTPAVVICPGGGYARRAQHEGEPVARWLNSIGFSAFVLDYRVAPYHHPYPLADVQRALRLVRHHAAEWGIDDKHLGVLGFSAGGHLASTAATLFDMNAVPEADAIVTRKSSSISSSVFRTSSGNSALFAWCSKRKPIAYNDCMVLSCKSRPIRLRSAKRSRCVCALSAGNADAAKSSFAAALLPDSFAVRRAAC